MARSAKRASASFGELNASLKDIELFLGRDFNPAAIALIQADAAALRDRAQELRAELDRCLAAAEQYVASAAPLGVAIQPPAPAARTGADAGAP